MKNQEFILYTKEKSPMLDDFMYFMELVGEQKEPTSEDSIRYHTCIRSLIEFAYRYGFTGNLYHAYVTHALVIDENAFSKSCEMSCDTTIGNVMELVRHDFTVWQLYFAFDYSLLDTYFHTDYDPILTQFDEKNFPKSEYPDAVVRCIDKLAKELATEKEVTTFMNDVIEFYKNYGVGVMGLYMAFRIGEMDRKWYLQPIHKVEQVWLKDLVGYEIPKKKLVENTEAFLAGKKANNCLLYGDAGTGKSSSIKGLLNEYYPKGLRMIEVYKHQYREMNEVIGKIRNRKYKYILYLDDLSFEEFEVDYKYLKAVIEGGLEDKVDNILIYATSNRRHLIQESFRDKELYKEQLHTSDTIQEKLSLAARFGVSIYFGAPERREFHEIVKNLARRHGIVKDEQALRLEANQWELSHGGLSGRTAQQFINYLIGQSEQ
ncbi:MAG: ATP-binding protein [Eubacteriales bacterium]